MDWKRLLAYITGSVDQELLLRNEYLVTEDRLLRHQIPGRVRLSMTPHPHARWMMQIARHVTMEEWGFLSPGQYLIHDRDGKYCPAFQQLIDTAGVTRVPLPPRSPNLNAYAEGWVRSIKEECLSRLILFGERALFYALYRVWRALPSRTPPSGQGERGADAFVRAQDGTGRSSSMSGKIGGIAQVLRARGGMKTTPQSLRAIPEGDI